LPSVDALRRAIDEERDEARAETDHLGGLASSLVEGERRVTQAARVVLEQARRQVRDGEPVPSLDDLRAMTLAALHRDRQPVLRPVINATGVVVNTNLGRAPLGAAAIAAVSAVAAGYSNLEFDLASGERGSRQTPVRSLLRELTGAEDALVVNNNAAAVLLALTALAQGREVIISRGELVEIGGGFRVPDVMLQSGARLVEVGTTNRTRVRDFAAAITPETAALLAVHPSNFRLVGFTEAPPLAELAALAHASGLLLIHDLGSGALTRTERYGLAHEPTPRESISAGVDLVCFSADKLLGGPQAGAIVGHAALVAQLGAHPLARALRIDKLTLAALEATLRLYRDGVPETLPIWRMIALPLPELRARAERWAERLRAAGVAAETIEGESAVGGGSLPGETLPTALCAVAPTAIAANGADGGGDSAGALARRLRASNPPIVARVLRKRLLLDPRTVPAEQDAVVVGAVVRAARELAGELPPV
jgi:L-seryl-tRNA(Ser) seleniumtransferase